MGNTDWVKPYVNRIFSSKSETEAESIRAEKLEHINMPFYKYCYVCDEETRTENTIDYNIENLKNDELYFQSPDKFNDPFDCFLGFSQMQTVRDIMIAELKRQKKYTKQTRKTLAYFINGEFQEQLSVEELLDEYTFSVVKDATTQFVIDTFGEDSIATVTTKCLINSMIERKDGEELFLKLINNTLTVRDSKLVIDLLYENDEFVKFLKEKLTVEYKDQILEMAKNDIKFKIETTPNSIFYDNSEPAFPNFESLRSVGIGNIGKENAIELTDIKKTLQQASKAAMKQSRKIIAEQFRVTCLSERMDSPLMWSHYANKHYGFCLEYDFTHTMLKRFPDLYMAQLTLLPVIYSSKRPLISQAFFNSKTMVQYLKKKTITDDAIRNIIYGLLFKSEDWDYEREWRIFMINSPKPTMKLPLVRKIFLGANMEEATKMRVVEIAKSKNIPIFQMSLSADKYKFDWYSITSTSQ